MHFVKAVILFAGIAAAAPASSSSPAKSSSVASSKAASATPSKSASVIPSKSASASVTPSKSASASVTSSKAASASVASSKVSSSAPVKAAAASATPVAVLPPTASQVALIKAGFNDFDSALDGAVSALTAFTGGTKINDQALAVSKAGETWQDATLKLLSDVQALAGYGTMATSDSANLANLITGDITDDLVDIYQLLQDKKPLFQSVDTVQNIHDGLYALQTELGQIGQALEPHFHSNDVAAVQQAGKTIFAAASDAINKYSS